MAFLKPGVRAAAVLGLAGLYVSPLPAQVPAINPSDMGKGAWIYDLALAKTNVGATSNQGLVDFLKAKGVKWFVVNSARGGAFKTQFSADLITRSHTAGLQILGYQRCFGDDVAAETQAGKDTLALGADGYVINAEIEYEGKSTQATTMMNGLRASYPNAFIAHAPFVYIDFHTAFPYVPFGKQCNAVMPQAYWRAAGIAKSPDVMVTDTNTQWSKWNTTWTNQGNGSAVKPVVPIGDGYNNQPGSELTAFVNAMKTAPNNPNGAAGYKGVSFWSTQHHTADMWNAIGAMSIGGQPDVIVDNAQSPGFAASANWSTATSAADKYGANYRFRSTGAVSDAAVFTASLPAAGNWEIYAMWPQGGNRSATAPFVLPNNTTVSRNQQTGGGVWNSLGTVNCAAGNNTVKLSCWTTAGFIVVADAVKFVKR